MTIVALLAGAGAGCQQKASIEEHRARVAVREYNLLLPRAHRERNTDLLAEVATEEQIGRIFAIVLGLQQKGLILDARQEQVTDEEVRLTAPGKVEVSATEQWWFRHVDFSTGRIAQPPKRERSKMRYLIELAKDNRWRVAKLEIVESFDVPQPEAEPKR